MKGTTRRVLIIILLISLISITLLLIFDGQSAISIITYATMMLFIAQVIGRLKRNE